MIEVAVKRGAFLLATALCGCLVDSDSPCGDHLQVNASGACECPTGFTAVDGACVEVAEEAAMASDCVAGAACACESSADCPDGELCDRFGSRSCSAAPVGLGQSCSGPADCAAGEASFCDVFASHSCQVQGCADRAGVCPGDYICCNYVPLSTSLCIPADTSPDGACPAPGQLVMRSSS